MSGAQYDVCCPTCGVGRREHCRTLTTNRVTDTHSARLEQVARARAALFDPTPPAEEAER